MKCKIKMKDKVTPVPGSVTGPEGKETGTCPKCDTPGVMLSIVGGFVRAHVVSSVELPENNPQPPTLVEPKVKYGKGLTEQSIAQVDHEGQPGDPAEAFQRRTSDVDGAYGRGTVEVPVKGDKGRSKLTPVPATEENVRTALEYWKSRKPRSDASRKRQSDMVSALVRMLEAFRKGRTAMRAETSPEGFTQHALPGPALVKGPNMAPVQRKWRNPVTDETEVAAAYLDGSLNERLDKTVADERPKAHRSASQRNNWRKKQRRKAAKRQS
jgi:hypothetical protein